MTAFSAASARTCLTPEQLDYAQRLAPSMASLSDLDSATAMAHPFELRNVHPVVAAHVQVLFDDGHYTHATLEALKLLDETVDRLASGLPSGTDRMMKALNESAPRIALNSLGTQSDRDEQMGFKFLFAGAMAGIRNPRAHSTSVRDSLDDCLDFLGLVSLLLRRLQSAGHPVT